MNNEKQNLVGSRRPYGILVHYEYEDLVRCLAAHYSGAKIDVFSLEGKDKFPRQFVISMIAAVRDPRDLTRLVKSSLDEQLPDTKPLEVWIAPLSSHWHRRMNKSFIKRLRMADGVRSDLGLIYGASTNRIPWNAFADIAFGKHGPPEILRGDQLEFRD